MASKRSKAIKEALILLAKKKGFAKKLKINVAKKKLRIEKSPAAQKAKRKEAIKKRRSKKGGRNVFQEIVEEFNIDGLKE